MKVLRFYIFCMAIFGLLVANSTNAHAQCTDPAGVAGEIIYNETHAKFVGCKADNTWQALHGDVAGAGYVPNAVEFATNAERLRTTTLTGVADSKLITGSFWVHYTDTGQNRGVFSIDDNGGTEGGFTIILATAGSENLRINMFNPSGTEILDYDSTTELTIDTWYHVMFSFDMANPANQYVYINDSLDTGTYSIYIDDVGDFTPTLDYYVGTNVNSGAPFRPGHLADFWLDMGTYIDLSVEANRRKFIDENGNPVYLGADGSLPTGSAPDIFLSGDTDDWHTNKGTGGGFTENGTLTTASTAPYTPVSANTGPTSGLVGWWKLDGDATDSSGNDNDGTEINGVDFSPIGIVGSAAEFDGSDDMIDAGSDASLDNLSPFSVSAWVQPDNEGSGGVGRIVTKRWWGLLVGDDSPFTENAFVYFHVTTGTEIKLQTLDNVWQPGQWTHVVLTHNGGLTAGTDVKIFVNGLEAAYQLTQNGTGSLVDDSGFNFQIGNRDSVQSYDGAIDDVRVYNRALTPAEIQELYEYPGGACSDPEGQQGAIIYNPDLRAYQGCTGGGWVGLNDTGYVPNAVEFPNLEYLVKNPSSFTGAVDTTSVTISAWLYADETSSSGQIAFRGDGIDFAASGGTIRDSYLRLYNDADTEIFGERWDNFIDPGWHHHLISVDLADPSRVHYYYDGVLRSFTADTFIQDELIDVQNTGYFFLGCGTSPFDPNATSCNRYFDQKMGDIWIDFGTYIDLSVAANRQKFINSDGNPVNLGADGSRPTGSAPDIFLSGGTDDWHTNKGTGGGFTENGELTTATSFPYTPPGAGGGCSSPDGNPGEIIYNSSDDVFQGCTADGWFALHE